MMQRRSANSRLQRLTFAGLAIVLAPLLTVASFGFRTASASAATCTDNDILKCGFSSPSDFINKVEADGNGINSAPDLKAVYAHYGLTSADYDNFASHAVAGEAMRDGQIIVNGKVVATGASSIGRIKSYQGADPFTVTIDGRNYYGNTNNQVFAAGVKELPVYVMMNSNNAVQFAVLSTCGNPEIPAPTPKPVPVPKPTPTPKPTPSPSSPVVSCKELTAAEEDSTGTTFTFTATASAGKGARLVFANFFFGDGTQQYNVPASSDGVTATATHTYAQSGNFTASAVLYFLVSSPTSTTTPVNAPACFASVAPATPMPPTSTTTTTTTPTTPPTTTPTTTLPNTGAGDVIGLFSVTSILGYFGYRQLKLHRAKNAAGQ